MSYDFYRTILSSDFCKQKHFTPSNMPNTKRASVLGKCRNELKSIYLVVM